MTTAFAGGGQSGGNVVINVLANIRNFQSGMNNVVNDMHNMSRQAQRASDGLFSIRNAIVAIGSARLGRDLIKNSLGDLAQFERFEMSLKTIFQSADAAKLKMKELWDFAAVTPFHMDEVVRASLVMESFGLNSKTYLKDIADLTAAFPHTNIDIVARAIGRIKSGDFGEALERMRDFGISSIMLREKGINFSGAGQVQNSAQELLDAVIGIIRERFGGLSDELGKTLFGRISTLIDNLRQSGRQLASGVFTPVKDAVEQIIAVIQRLQTDGTLDVWAARIRYWFLQIKDGAMQVGFFLLYIADIVTTYWPAIEPIIKGVAVAMLLNWLVHSKFVTVSIQVVGAIWTLIRALTVYLFTANGATAATKLLKLAIQSLEAATGIGIILIIVGALTMLILQSENARRALQRFFEWGQEGLNNFATYMETRLGFLGKIIAGFARLLGSISGGIASFVEPVQDSSARMAEEMQKHLDEVTARNAELMKLQMDPLLQQIINQNDLLPNVTPSDTRSGSEPDVVNEAARPFEFARKALESQMENQQILNKLANFGEGTFKFWNDTKSGLLAIREVLLQEISVMNNLIPGLTGELKEKALDKLWDATKRSNEILLQIKENTDPRGDFNLPSGIRPISLFETRASREGAMGITFANAQFVLQFKNAPKNIEEVKEMFKVVEAGIYQQLTDRVVRE